MDAAGVRRRTAVCPGGGRGSDAENHDEEHGRLIVGLSFFVTNNLIAATIILASLQREKGGVYNTQKSASSTYTYVCRSYMYCTVTFHVVGDFGVTLASHFSKITT